MKDKNQIRETELELPPSRIHHVGRAWPAMKESACNDAMPPPRRLRVLQTPSIESNSAVRIAMMRRIGPLLG